MFLWLLLLLLLLRDCRMGNNIEALSSCWLARYVCRMTTKRLIDHIYFPLPRRSKQWARPESFVFDVRGAAGLF